MVRNVVMLGGSFNPPTLAHLRLMQTALDTLPEAVGVFVPSSHAYVMKKMNHAGGRILCFSEQMRMDMLQAMCGDDPRLSCSALDYRQASVDSFGTLEMLQQDYPEARVWFLAGADKMALFELMQTRRGLLDKFGVMVAGRGEQDPARCVRESDILRPYADRFAYCSLPEEMETVSSTLVRRSLLSGGDVSAYLHPGVMRLLADFRPEECRGMITRFRGERAFLDNEFRSPVVWAGSRFPSAQAVWQANATGDPDRDTELMREILRAKFRQDPRLAAQLLGTRNSELVNGHQKDDPIWGMNLKTWQGENRLGRLLMEVREELRQEARDGFRRHPRAEK